ncbi:MAG: 5-formyltetrahydrofolate cyclo-ligase [Candidatus Gastranaerophilales bacterium]|nr:5-formyltetrahydrofolate cyclo-ligase [Candidatus Gastranaerophilales bacterium]
MDKSFLRKKNIALRKNLDNIKASRVIVSKILRGEAFLNAENILIFYPLKYEINLLELLNVPDKKFFLPRTNGDKLEICPFEGKLFKSKFNILEPETPAIDVSIIDLAYIPAVAADKNLNRIGYGKGYYDRLFSDENFRAQKIIVIQKELVIDFIPADKSDRKADFILTD